MRGYRTSPSSTGIVEGRVKSVDGFDVTGGAVFLVDPASGTAFGPSVYPLGSTGTYKIRDVPPGTSYAAYCKPLGATPLAPQTYKGIPGIVPFPGLYTPISVAAGEATRGIDFNLPSAGQVAVQVTDTSGSPVAGASLLLMTRRGMLTLPPTLTDSSGAGIIANVASGGVLGITASGFVPQYWPNAIRVADGQPLVLSPGDTILVSVTLTPSS